MQNNERNNRRLIALYSAANVLAELHSAMPVHRLRLDAAEKMIRKLADEYKRRCEALAELDKAERKLPMRVTTSGRRRQLSPPIPAVKGARRLCKYCPRPAAGPVERTCGSAECVNRDTTLVSPVIECTRCGSPAGSNRDCPTCYPMKPAEADENQG